MKIIIVLNIIPERYQNTDLEIQFYEGIKNEDGTVSILSNNKEYKLFREEENEYWNAIEPVY